MVAFPANGWSAVRQRVCTLILSPHALKLVHSNPGKNSNCRGQSIKLVSKRHHGDILDVITHCTDKDGFPNVGRLNEADHVA